MSFPQFFVRASKLHVVFLELFPKAPPEMGSRLGFGVQGLGCDIDLHFGRLTVFETKRYFSKKNVNLVEAKRYFGGGPD